MPDIGGPFPQNQRIQYNRGQPPSPYGTPGLWPGQQAPQVNPWDAVGPPPGAMESGLGSLRRGQNASEGYTRSLQDNTPWIGQQPGINRLFGMAGQNADSPLGFMPGPTVADQSALTRQAAGAGGGLLGRGVGAPAGEDYYRQVLSGRYLDQSTNPALRGLAERGASDIQRQYQTVAFPSVYRPGNIGSGSEQNRMVAANIGLGNALGRNYDSVYGADYGRERGFMQQAPGMMQQLYAGQREDIGMGSGIGRYQDAYGQSLVDADRERFEFMRDAPYLQQQRYQEGILGAGVMGNQSFTQSQNEQYGWTRKGGGGGGTTAGQWAGLGLGALSLFCTRLMKDHHGEVQGVKALEQLRALQIAVWRYKDEVSDQNPNCDTAYHMGPYAEDFQQVFNLGDGRTISMIDALGVSLAACKGAGEKIEVLEQRLTALESAGEPELQEAG